jgi:hypothetical protein
MNGKTGAQICQASGAFGACDCGVTASKRIFVTAALYPGNFGGLAGADAKCTTAAEAVTLGGTWKAWLSDSTTDAIDRIAEVGPWVLLGTTTIAFNNKANLATLPLAAVLINERGETLGEFAERRVWTGTQLGGASTYSAFELCQNWTTGNPYDGQFGNADSKGNTWTHGGNAGCTNTLRLYCIEQ